MSEKRQAGDQEIKAFMQMCKKRSVLAGEEGLKDFAFSGTLDYVL